MDRNGGLDMTIDNEGRWEGRLWTLFQLGLVALVGFLALQAMDSQKLLASMVSEQRHTNQRLDRIEASVDRVNEDRYKMQGLSGDLVRFERRLATVEDKLDKTNGLKR